MPARRHIGVRHLVTAVVVMLAALLGTECVSAQAMSKGTRPAAAVGAYAAVPYEHSGTAEDDCKPRPGPRRSTPVQTSTGASVRVCDCDVRRARPDCRTASVTVRERAASDRSVDRPLLHQSFRC